MNPTARHRVDVYSVGNHTAFRFSVKNITFLWRLSFRQMHTYVASPLVVSLSLTRNVPRLFCRFRRSLSESRRVIFPKYHLPKWATENQCRAATERHQQTDASSQMAGKRDFTGVHTGKPLLTFICRCTVDKDKKKRKHGYVWALKRKVMFKRETRGGLCTLLLGWSLMEPRSCWGYNRSRQLSGNERATNPLLCDMEGQRKNIL